VPQLQFALVGYSQAKMTIKKEEAGNRGTDLGLEGGDESGTSHFYYTTGRK